MLDVFEQIAPFFAVVLLGWLSAKPGVFSAKGMIDEPGLTGLNAFIFKIALPPLLFLAMTRAPQAIEEGVDLVTGYAIATVGLYAVMRLLAYIVFRLKGGENALFGYVSINGNVGFLGLPLIALTLSEEAVLPVTIVLSFDIILMMSGTAIWLEITKGGPGGAFKAFFRAVFSPVPVAILLGAAWGWASMTYEIDTPEMLTRLLTLLGSAAAPAALFATGAILGRKSGDQRLGEISVLSLAKLVAHPVLVALALGWIAPDLPPLWVAAGVLAAACPVSNNAVLLASNFGRYEHRASAAVLISTALSLVTYAAAAAWLQAD